MNSRHLPGGIIEVEIVRLSLDGYPSAIHNATIKIYFLFGSSMSKDLDFNPDGIMFEVFKEQLRALIRW